MENKKKLRVIKFEPSFELTEDQTENTEMQIPEILAKRGFDTNDLSGVAYDIKVQVHLFIKPEAEKRKVR